MKFIVFDLDDTLIPSSYGYELALRSIGLGHGLPSFAQARAKVKSTLPNGHTSARSRWLYFKDWLETNGSFSPKRLMTMMDVYERSLHDFLNSEWRRLRRSELLQHLKVKYTLALLTNENTRTQVLKLNAIDPDFQHFALVVTSEEIGCEKPDARIFDALVARLKISKNDEVVFVGDDIESDLMESKKRGWRAIWTQEFLDNPKADPRWETIKALDDLKGVLLT